MKNGGKLTAVIIAAFSLLLVFGALLTALAETGFTAFGPTKTSPSEEPAVTAIILPTTEEKPTEVQPTKKVEKTSSPEKTTTPTKTETIPETKTAAPSDEPGEDGTCTKPTGWVDYKINSGDTLFSISQAFQTDVATLKSGNCLTSSQIITGKILWVPNTVTLTPTKTPKPTTAKTPIPTIDGCYILTLSHLGQGADAVPDIANSSGCTTGKYKAGEIITLTAAPSSGWEVGSWVGTTNDSSTSLTNTVKMPAKDHLAKPVYVGICYPLTLSSGSNGGNPVPDKTKSSGCTTGEYVAGEKITFTAAPNTGFTVDAWTGTDGGTNKLTMPASAATVSVSYSAIPCYTMTLGVASGSGSVPTASVSTMGCSAGEYAEGEVVTVTVAPAGGGIAESWVVSPPATYSTTADPFVIKVTMGDGACTVEVTYNP